MIYHFFYRFWTPNLSSSWRLAQTQWTVVPALYFAGCLCANTLLRATQKLVFQTEQNPTAFELICRCMQYCMYVGCMWESSETSGKAQTNTHTSTEEASSGSEALSGIFLYLDYFSQLFNQTENNWQCKRSSMKSMRCRHRKHLYLLNKN